MAFTIEVSFETFSIHNCNLPTTAAEKDWMVFARDSIYAKRAYAIAIPSVWVGASNKDGVGKTSNFLALCINISKTVQDTSKVTIND